MKKYPKYIVLPVMLLLYFAAMLVYSIRRNHGALPEDFGIIVTVECVIIVALYFALRTLHRRRNP